MRETIRRLRDAVARLLRPPDELMLELGAGGELLVARLRAVLSALVMLLPLVAAVGGAGSNEVLIGLGAALFVNVFAQIWLALAHNRRRHRWLPYATGTYDITTTTAVLALLGLSDPVAALNSVIVWCFYPIAIALTALRNDGRLTLYVGGLAIVQYGLLAWIVFALVPSPEQLISIGYGTASVGGQLERLILLLIMTVVGIAIVSRMQRLVELSGRDGLTGLPNRAWLLQRLPRLFETVRRGGGSLTLALLDLDRFKRVNDEVGHLAGNRAIRHVVAELGHLLGDDEHLVRIGGQEFVLLLRSPIGSAWERVDRMRRALTEAPFIPDRGADPQPITFSGGLAAYPADGGDASALLRSADRRLQRAKQEGRNRVIARDV